MRQRRLMQLHTGHAHRHPSPRPSAPTVPDYADSAVRSVNAQKIWRTFDLNLFCAWIIYCHLKLLHDFCLDCVEPVRVPLTHLCPQDSWEIVEGLRGGFGNVMEPQKQEGYMLKRRKWPMKGWHKVKKSTWSFWKDLLPIIRMDELHEVFLECFLVPVLTSQSPGFPLQ